MSSSNASIAARNRFAMMARMKTERNQNQNYAANSDTIFEKSCIDFFRETASFWAWKSNFKSLWHRPRGFLSPLDGIRSLALLWVMCFHALVYMDDAVSHQHEATAENKSIVARAVKNNVVFASGHMGVDIFFVLSGFLIGRMLLMEYDRNGTISLFSFWGRRWLRLVPVYVTAIVLTILLGPNADNCSHHWWTNLLFINNFTGASTVQGACIEQSWSISVEFQFYIVSPLIIGIVLCAEHYKEARIHAKQWTDLQAKYHQVCVECAQDHYDDLSKPLLSASGEISMPHASVEAPVMEMVEQPSSLDSLKYEKPRRCAFGMRSKQQRMNPLNRSTSVQGETEAYTTTGMDKCPLHTQQRARNISVSNHRPKLVIPKPHIGSPLTALSPIFVLLLVSLAIRLCLVIHALDDASPSSKFPEQAAAVGDWLIQHAYTKSYARFGPYLLGFIVAYVYRHDARQHVLDKTEEIVIKPPVPSMPTKNASVNGIPTPTAIESYSETSSISDHSKSTRQFAEDSSSDVPRSPRISPVPAVLPEEYPSLARPNRSNTSGSAKRAAFRAQHSSTRLVSSSSRSESTMSPQVPFDPTQYSDASTRWAVRRINNVHERRHKPVKNKTGVITTSRGLSKWLLVFCCFLVLGIILVVYPGARCTDMGLVYFHDCSKNEYLWASSFIILRTLYSAFVAIIIYGCLKVWPELHWIRRVLSARGWIPIARLSYSIYLIQLIILWPLEKKIYSANEHGVVELARSETSAGGASILALCGVLAGAPSLAFLVYMLIEKPFMNMRKFSPRGYCRWCR